MNHCSATLPVADSRPDEADRSYGGQRYKQYRRLGAKPVAAPGRFRISLRDGHFASGLDLLSLRRFLAQRHKRKHENHGWLATRPGKYRASSLGYGKTSFDTHY